MKLDEITKPALSDKQFVCYLATKTQYMDQVVGPFASRDEALAYKSKSSNRWISELNKKKIYKTKFGATDPNGKFCLTVNHKDSGEDRGCIGPYTTKELAEAAMEKYEQDNCNHYSDSNRHEVAVFPFSNPTSQG